MVNTFRVSQTGFYATVIETACNTSHPFTDRIFRIDTGSFATPVASDEGTQYVTTDGGKFTVRTGVRPSEERYKWTAYVYWQGPTVGNVITYWNDDTGSIVNDLSGLCRVYDDTFLLARCVTDTFTTAITVEQDYTLIHPSCKIPSLGIAPLVDRTHVGLEVDSPSTTFTVSNLLLTREADEIGAWTSGPFIDGVAPLVTADFSGGPPADGDWVGDGNYPLWVDNDALHPAPGWRIATGPAGVKLKVVFGEFGYEGKFVAKDRLGNVRFFSSSTYAPQVLDGLNSFTINLQDHSSGTGTLTYG